MKRNMVMTKVVIENYDDYLLTNRNMNTFIAALRGQGYSGSINMAGGKLIIDFGAHLITKEIMKYCGDFWEGQASIMCQPPMCDEFMLLEAIDDIKAANEIAGEDDGMYRKIVQSVINRLGGN